MLLPQSTPAVKNTFVSTPALPDDPLMLLKQELNWAPLLLIFKDCLREAGRNVDGTRPGRRTDAEFWLPVVVLFLVRKLNSREMECLLGESGTARLFCNVADRKEFQICDHSSLYRLLASLAKNNAYQKLNAEIIRQAQNRGLTDTKTLSVDTTAQAANIPYPNEPNILAMAAKSVLRITRQLRKHGRRKLKRLQNLCRSLIKKNKEHCLFAKTPNKKEEILKQMVRKTTSLLGELKIVSERMVVHRDRASQSLAKRVQHVSDGLAQLLPQIEHWMTTKQVAQNKIIHVGLDKVRAIVRNKPGKRCEFGLKHIVVRLAGGFVLTQGVAANASDVTLVVNSLEMFEAQFGKSAIPTMYVGDRGFWSDDNLRLLKSKGVPLIAIQPRGRKKYRVFGKDREEALRLRSRNEGVIGSLKTTYGMDRPKERRSDMLAATVQRSALAFNVNKFLKLATTARTKDPAQGRLEAA